VQLPPAGKWYMRDSNFTQERNIDTANHRIASQYEAEALHYLSERESLLRRSGAAYSRMMTTTEAVEAELVVS
jgi:hypothetical protein